MKARFTNYRTIPPPPGSQKTTPHQPGRVSVETRREEMERLGIVPARQAGRQEVRVCSGCGCEVRSARLGLCRVCFNAGRRKEAHVQ